MPPRPITCSSYCIVHFQIPTCSHARMIASRCVYYCPRICTYGRFDASILAFNALGLHITSTTFYEFTIANLFFSSVKPWSMAPHVILQEHVHAETPHGSFNFQPSTCKIDWPTQYRLPAHAAVLCTSPPPAMHRNIADGTHVCSSQFACTPAPHPLHTRRRLHRPKLLVSLSSYDVGSTPKPE